LVLIAIACKKQPATPILIAHEEVVTLKTGEWKAYPYIGGPGEDSMYYSFSPDMPGYYQPKNLVAITIKKKDGTIVPAKEFINVSQKDSGYLYDLGARTKIEFWWIQKQFFTVPDADSAFIKFKY
jgi:hypothetical protein